MHCFNWKIFWSKSTQIVPQLVELVYRAAGSLEQQVINLGKRPLSTLYLPVVFTFLSVALTGLLRSKGDCDSAITCASRKITERITKLFKNHYYTAIKLNDLFMLSFNSWRIPNCGGRYISRLTWQNYVNCKRLMCLYQTGFGRMCVVLWSCGDVTPIWVSTVQAVAKGERSACVKPQGCPVLTFQIPSACVCASCMPRFRFSSHAHCEFGYAPWQGRVLCVMVSFLPLGQSLNPLSTVASGWFHCLVPWQIWLLLQFLMVTVRLLVLSITLQWIP